MKKMLLLFVVFACGCTKAYSQYFDWVYDTKCTEAFIKEHAYQYAELMKWYGEMKKYEKTTKKIEEKTLFIEMVRRTLFMSLQDVTGIIDGKDTKNIENIFSDIHSYQSEINTIVAANPEFTEDAEKTEKYIVKHCDELLNVVEMAITGNDERNLLDKNQRLMMLDYVTNVLKDLRRVQKGTLVAMKLGSKVQYIKR